MDVLAAEIKALDRSKNRLRAIVIVLGGVVAALIAGIVLTIVGFSQARDRDTQQIESARIEGCRNRNDAARVTRQFAEGQFAIFETATLNGDPTERELSLLEELRATVPLQSETEFDCTGDNQITGDDYPPR
jgi:hypothetical protein